CRRIVWRRQEPRLAVGDDLLDAHHASPHDGLARRHGLEHGKGHAFVMGGKTVDVEDRIQLWDVEPTAEKLHPVPDTKAPGEGLEHRSPLPVAYQDEPGLWNDRQELGKGPQE